MLITANFSNSALQVPIFPYSSILMFEMHPLVIEYWLLPSLYLPLCLEKLLNRLNNIIRGLLWHTDEGRVTCFDSLTVFEGASGFYHAALQDRMW